MLSSYLSLCSQTTISTQGIYCLQYKFIACAYTMPCTEIMVWLRKTIVYLRYLTFGKSSLPSHIAFFLVYWNYNYGKSVAYAYLFLSRRAISNIHIRMETSIQLYKISRDKLPVTWALFNYWMSCSSWVLAVLNNTIVTKKIVLWLKWWVKYGKVCQLTL